MVYFGIPYEIDNTKEKKIKDLNLEESKDFRICEMRFGAQ